MKKNNIAVLKCNRLFKMHKDLFTFTLLTLLTLLTLMKLIKNWYRTDKFRNYFINLLNT